MNRTTHYNLGLWEGTDYPNYTMPNENMNIIDTNLKAIDERSLESKSKADACLDKIGTLNLQEMNDKILSNTVATTTNTARIETLNTSVKTITSPTKSETGNRITRSVEFTSSIRALNYTDSTAEYGGTIEITADRLGLKAEDSIRVISVMPTTSATIESDKHAYIIPISYVGKRTDGTHCFSASGVTPNPNTSSNVQIFTPTGLIVEFIKL